MFILGKPSYRPWTSKLSVIPFYMHMCVYVKIGGEMFSMILVHIMLQFVA